MGIIISIIMYIHVLICQYYLVIFIQLFHKLSVKLWAVILGIKIKNKIAKNICQKCFIFRLYVLFLKTRYIISPERIINFCEYFTTLVSSFTTKSYNFSKYFIPLASSLLQNLIIFLYILTPLVFSLPQNLIVFHMTVIKISFIKHFRRQNI